MEALELNEDYWSQRYAHGQTQWDVGAVTPPLKAYIDQVEDRSLEVLVPGGGNSYEAEYLWSMGFTNTYLLDISKAPLQNFRYRIPEFPPRQLLHKDFFALEGGFDLILEQTFFCALHPSLRAAYCQHMLQLLKPGGRLVGVLFDDALFTDHPPFGGHITEYMGLFGAHFDLKVMAPCYNSIAPRKGREVFMICLNTQGQV